MISFTPRHLYPWYPFEDKVGGRCGENKSVLLPGIEPRFHDHLANTIVTVLTELSRLLINELRGAEPFVRS
jgi:hypothetical protein